MSTMKQFKRGYTAGVFDVFHIGHLNLLRNAKGLCEFLVVGVNSDELVQSYKHKKTIQPLCDRMDIVGSIRFVDSVVENHSLDKISAWEKYKFDVIFIGDDWKGTDRWNKTEEELKKLGVQVVYLPHTAGISSSMIRGVIENKG